jgi:hypothetical protein
VLGAALVQGQVIGVERHDDSLICGGELQLVGIWQSAAARVLCGQHLDAALPQALGGCQRDVLIEKEAERFSHGLLPPFAISAPRAPALHGWRRSRP